jgi:hypothetical protein
MEHRIEIDGMGPVGDAAAAAGPQPSAPYAAPTLAVYGPVATLTRSVGSQGKKDGSRGSRRTGF